MFSPIHRELGVEPTEGLTAELIRRAVEQRIAETTDLDWKERLPDNKDPKWRDELAKDLAAMANSGGGWIVYGVAEDDSRACRLAPVEWRSALEQQIRQIAYARVGPAVTDLTFHPVAIDEGAVVAVHVAESDRTPHLAMKGNNAFVAPRRNGPHTVFLTERELEQGYRQRHDAAVSARDELYAMYEQAIADFGAPQDVVGVFVARPRQPVVRSRTFDAAAAGEVVQRAQQIRLSGSNDPIVLERLRPGLRSWVARTNDQKQRYTIHSDGTVTFTFQVGPVWEPSGGPEPTSKANQAITTHVEGWLAAAGALLAAHAQHLGVAGGYMVRCGLIAPPGPIMLRVFEIGNWLLGEEYMVPIHRFVPLDADLDPTAERAEFRSALAGVALDVINQGGAQHLRLLDDPE